MGGVDRDCNVGFDSHLGVVVPDEYLLDQWTLPQRANDQPEVLRPAPREQDCADSYWGL